MGASRIDLNSDVGESYGAWAMGDDAALMPYITSANIACGWHAGDPSVMRATVRLAARHGVRIGAHPSYPDRLGFGRRPMQVSPEEARDYVLYQIGALAAFARAEATRLQHVKPHGALYHVAARDAVLSRALAEAVAEVDPALILVGTPGSELLRAGRDIGLRVAREGFADRAYHDDGSLVSRRLPGGVITDPDAAAEQTLMLLTGHVRTITGRMLPLEVDTVCLHGDTPGAAAIARRVRERLAQARVEVVSLEEVIAGQVS
jgi:UPF0271 protein